MSAKISVSECRLKEIGNIPSRYDLVNTLKEFNIQFVDFDNEVEQEFYENDIDCVVLFCPKQTDPWDFFKAMHSLTPDGFLFHKVDNGTIVYMAWNGEEKE